MSDDCISRQAAIDVFKNAIGDKYPFICEPILITLSLIPSVTPQPKTGHWRHYEGMLICSECGIEFYDAIMEYCGDDVPKCCPNCGAKMVVPQESEQ